MAAAPARVLALLSLLQARRDWPLALLAARLEVSARTVRRDVEQLRSMGYEVRAVRGPHGGYRLEAGADLPPLFFDDDQAVALAVALQTVATSGADVGEAAERARATLATVLPARLRHRLEALDVTSVPHPGPAVDPAVLLAVSGATRRREVLRFDHTSTTGESSGRLEPRRVEPHHVVARGGRWYLLAWDLDRGDWRTFRVDGMTPRTPTGPRFAPREVPGGDVAAFVAARFRGSAAAPGRGPGTAWPCAGEVVLGAPARHVLPYAGDGLVEPLGPDRCRVVAGSWSWVALAASFGRFDAPVESAAPAELADAFALLARRFAAAAPASGTRRTR